MIPKNILCHIRKSAATNVDLELIEKTTSDMIAKKIIDNDLKILNDFRKCEVSEDDVEILCLEQVNTIKYSKFIS